MGPLKRSSTTRVAVAIAWTAALCSVPATAQPLPGPPQAAPTPSTISEARANWDRGIRYYDEGAYDLASIEFQRAYSLAPNYRILYNLGSVAQRLSDNAAAYQAFEQYLREGGSEIPPDRRNQVELQLQGLRTRIATIDVSVNVEGAEILVDDVAVGKAPLARPLIVNAGKRKLTVLKERMIPVSRVVAVAGGESGKVEFKLVSAEPPVAPGLLPPPVPVLPFPAAKAAAEAAGSPRAEARNARAIPWLAWGITGALAATSVTTGLLAFGASRDLDHTRNTPDASRSELDHLSNRVKTFSLVSDVFLAGTAVAGGVSLYLTLRSKPHGEPVSARVRFAPGAMVLSTDF